MSSDKPYEKKTEPIKAVDKKNKPADDTSLSIEEKIKHYESQQTQKSSNEETDLDIFEQPIVKTDAPAKKSPDLDTVNEESGSTTAILEKDSKKNPHAKSGKVYSCPNDAASAKNMEEAIAILKSGKILVQSNLAVLNLSNQTFQHPIRIENCTIEQFSCGGAEFEAAVTLESCNISKEFSLNGERPTTLHDGLIIRKTQFSGGIFFHRANIGKLTMSDCRASQPLSIHESVYENGLHIHNSQLHSLVGNGCRFQGPVNILNSRISDNITLENASFLDNCIFSSLQTPRCSFQKSTFSRKLEMFSCNFDKTCNFYSVTCYGSSNLLSCIFQGTVNFQKAKFHQDVNIRKSDFFQDVSFSKSLCDGTFNLEETIWNAIADFSNTIFQGLRLIKSHFGGSTNFQEAVVYGTSVIIESEFKQQCNFCRSVWFQRLDLRESKFMGRLGISGLVADYALVERKQIEGHLDSERQKDYLHLAQEYRILKQIFHKQDRYEDEDWAYREGRRAERQQKKIGILSFWRLLTKPLEFLFFDLGAGYGTKPANLLVLGMVFVLLFGLGYSIIQERCEYEITRPLVIPQITVNQHLQVYIQNVITSLIIFSPVGVGQLSLSNTPTTTWEAKKHIPQIIMLLENTLGWCLLLIFIFSFFRKLSH